jgi:hypothetical protein
MPAYLFTFHSYRSWNADRTQGFVQQGQGIQTRNVALARYYDRQATQAPVQFSERQQQVILWIVWDACNRRDWRLHTTAFETSHVHILVSWRSDETWQIVRKKLKNLIGWALSRELEREGRRWMVRGASRKRVSDQQHFDYLINVYLPRHRGLFWKEGNANPIAPHWARFKGLTAEPLSSDSG